jgi:acyl-CoA dehydrogenase
MSWDGSQAPDDDSGFREYVRSRLAGIVLPNAERWEEEGKLGRQCWRALGEEGLLSLGHTGADFMRSAVYLEELGRTGYAGIRAAIAVHAYMALSYLELFGTEEQKSHYLDGARRGQRIAALAISEADAGSDLRNLATRAERCTGGGYRINGEKCHVTNGSQADFFVTLVRTGQASPNLLAGASMVIIDADLRGVTREPQPMLGWRSADICTVRFADIPIPDNCMLGGQNQALGQLMKALDFERLVAGLLAVGGVGFCLELLRAFIQSHRIGSSAMSSNHALRQNIAELDSDFELVRQYAYHAAWRQSNGRLDARTASILKLKSTELAVKAAQKCLQYHGARGYQRGSVASRLYCDAIGGTIAGGASELLRDTIYELG